MRPIDADAMYQRYCVDKRGLDGIYDTTDLPDMLKEMPTIDAIPVEWLMDLANRGYFVDNAVTRWKYEQEVQNG